MPYRPPADLLVTIHAAGWRVTAVMLSGRDNAPLPPPCIASVAAPSSPSRITTSTHQAMDGRESGRGHAERAAGLADHLVGEAPFVVTFYRLSSINDGC
jgi:hypothetical protein